MQRVTLLLIGAALAADPASAQRRAMTPEDLVRIDDVRSVAWSPDGRFAAVEIRRPGPVLGGSTPTGQLSILDVGSAALRRLEVEGGKYIGFWQPVWSPAGRYLAFLSADADAVIRPFIWDTREARPKLLRHLEVQINIADPPIVWLDNERVVFLARDPSTQSSGALHADLQPGRNATDLWQRARAGGAAVTVLESRGPERPAGGAQVVLVDVMSGQRRTLVTGAIHRLSASPDGRRLAFFREAPGAPSQRVASFFDEAELYDAVNWGTELHVFDVTRGTEQAQPVVLRDPRYESLSWSPAGRLAIPGYPRERRDGQGLVVLTGSRLEPLVIRGLDTVSRDTPAWLVDELVVRARAAGADRWDWWQLSPTGPARLTSRFQTPPSALWQLPGNSLLGAADGDLWRFASGTEPTNLTRGIEEPVTGLRPVSVRRGLFVASVGGRQSLLRVSESSVHVTPLAAPPPGARLRALSPLGDAGIYVGNSDTGTRLWLTGGSGRPLSELTQVWHGNRWASEVDTGSWQRIRYSTANRDTLAAWLLLPRRQAARALPLVVWVYPGTVYNERSTAPYSILSTDYLNPHLFAGLGYAVLLPSIPLDEDPRVPTLPQLPIGVLPVLDTLIARGTADSSRLAVIGRSGGGYATLGLIGQTRRFRAAIAIASYSNLVSLYGTFYAQYRYGEAGHPQKGQVLRMLNLERGFMALGGPPWRLADRYLRDSPVFLADSVHTPVMLVHGDQDFIPIQQAEEFFTALYRQDKRARFVRYHGEGHGPTSRANLLDFWSRITDWLGEHLAPAPAR